MDVPAIAKALRPHQWVKNVLLFAPVMLAHEVTAWHEGELPKLGAALLAFIAFSFAASAGYVWNDLRDREADRLHDRKKHRPFASGALSANTGAGMIVALLLGASAIAMVLPWNFLILLAIYTLLTGLYTAYLKSKPIVDVLTLAGLYSLRILAGGSATLVPVSPWLIAFSGFFFLSLALVKRYAELVIVDRNHGLEAAGRGYHVSDLQIIAVIGPTSGYLSVLVMAVYLNESDAAHMLYRWPNLLWLNCPVLLYWITRVWFLAHRKYLKDDPIAFAMRDGVSYVTLGLVGLITWLATELSPINL